MLFNSYTFIFVFLPLTVIGYHLVSLLGQRKLNLAWIVGSSIVFYGAWTPLNLVIMVPSIAANYGLAVAIRRADDGGFREGRLATWLTTLGIVFNLCFLGYFKYKNFFLGSVNDLAGTQWTLTNVILPLGISFITFQKIAFLLDVRARVVERFDVFDFLTFVFFFPQLIAGPIVHYREMMPQFAGIRGGIRHDDLAVGLCLFSIGLFKKVVLADGVSAYSTPQFNAAADGQVMTFLPGWMGAIAYTFQIYFDFSGYSDMAIGLARVFGIVLPANFNSPLRASSIIEFWGRWHMTLTRFLTAYIYTPLVMKLTRSRMASGKNLVTRKRAPLDAFVVLVAWPTLVTMGLSGLWHGAGVTFIAWGALHGLFLIVNHAWRQWRPRREEARYARIMGPVGFILTFVAVVVAMVFFRAASMKAAGAMLAGMAGLHGISMPTAILDQAGSIGRLIRAAGVSGDDGSGSLFVWAAVWLVLLFLVTTLLPNSLQILRQFGPALYLPDETDADRRRWSRKWPAAVALNGRWALLFAALFVAGALGLDRPSEFLYWQF